MRVDQKTRTIDTLPLRMATNAFTLGECLILMGDVNGESLEGRLMSAAVDSHISHLMEGLLRDMGASLGRRAISPDEFNEYGEYLQKIGLSKKTILDEVLGINDTKFPVSHGEGNVLHVVNEEFVARPLMYNLSELSIEFERNYSIGHMAEYYTHLPEYGLRELRLCLSRIRRRKGGMFQHNYITE